MFPQRQTSFKGECLLHRQLNCDFKPPPCVHLSGGNHSACYSPNQPQPLGSMQDVLPPNCSTRRRPVASASASAAFEQVFASRHTVLPFSDRLSLQADLGAIWTRRSVRGAPCANGLGLSFKISHPEEGEQRERGERVAPHLPLSALTYSRERDDSETGG